MADREWGSKEARSMLRAMNVGEKDLHSIVIQQGTLGRWVCFSADDYDWRIKITEGDITIVDMRDPQLWVVATRVVKYLKEHDEWRADEIRRGLSFNR